MTDVGNGQKADGSQLRERPTAKPLHMHDSESAKQKVLELNEQEDRKDEREKKTYGRTPDGTGKY
jgi:phosphatidylethanolamine N-methyltransferase